MLRPPPTPTLLPYTTLFRSCRDDRHPCADAPGGSSYRQAVRQEEPVLVDDVDDMRLAVHLVHEPLPLQLGKARSEEHTSELQSLRHLVCRLLLEKKNSHDRT